MASKHHIKKNGPIAISPLLLMGLLFIVFGTIMNGFSNIPILLVFIITSAYAILTLQSRDIYRSILCFSKGAGNPTLLLMIWIFVLSGAFASSARAMGAVDEAVCLTLSLLPDNMLLAGIFLSACFVSISIGTSVGTVVALVPIAAGLADKTGLSLPLMVAATVGGAFFGDNLSFISDTTIAATKTQECSMKDKFRVNIHLVMPAALITTVVYLFLGSQSSPSGTAHIVSLIKIIPYAAVITMALTGVNVIIVLFLGNILTGVIGIMTGSFTFPLWCSSMTNGITSMGELIIISMMAGGLLEIIRLKGGITWIVYTMRRHVHSKRAAEFFIGIIVSVANLCTANNTVAILSVGKISHDIALQYNVDKRKSASILDTFSCCTQALIPYGAQMLMASGLSSLSPLSIIPYMLYPMIVLAIISISIFFRYPQKYS